jgi:hypothetical protein
LLNPRQLNHDLHLPSLLGQEFGAKQLRDGQWFARCPFHAERTGSLSITYKKARGWCYKCHGCHEYGDTIKFLQKYHGLTFRQVLDRYGDNSNRQYAEQIVDSEAQRWYARIPDYLLVCDLAGCNAKREIDAASLLAVLEGEYCGWEVAPDGIGAVCPKHSRERQAR